MRKGYLNIRVYLVLIMLVIGIIFITSIIRNVKPVIENRYNRIDKILNESP